MSEVEVEAAPPELRERMGKTRGLFSGYVRSLRSRSSVDDQAWDELEEALLRADVGVATTTALLEDLRGRVHDGELRGADAVVAALREDLRRSLDTDNGTELSFETGGADNGNDAGICVWLFVGVNGVGKTTTIGKVARRQKAEGRSVLLAAGDTFRAAAAEQLDHLGRNAPTSRSCAGPRAATPAPWSSTPCSGPRPGATTWCWPTPPGVSTPRSTWWRS